MPARRGPPKNQKQPFQWLQAKTVNRPDRKYLGMTWTLIRIPEFKPFRVDCHQDQRRA